MKEKEIENVGMAYKSPKVNVIEMKYHQSILASSTESFGEKEGRWNTFGPDEDIE